MRTSHLKLVLSVVAVLLLSSVAASARQEAGRVVVSVGAVDKEGRVVEGLKAEDLRVSVEGQPQPLLSLERYTGEPLHVVILLDASASQERVLPFAQGAADRLVPAIIMRGGANDAAVVSFTGDAKVVQGLTADVSAVRRAIASVKAVVPPGYAGGGVVLSTKRPNMNDPASRVATTAIWEALVSVCEEVFARAKPGRRIVVLVTDGVDTSSRIKLSEAVERLQREGVVVYGIGLADKFSFDPVNKKTVRLVSERTGGRALFPKKNEDLPVAFEQVRRELFGSYALTFAAPPGPRDKALKLRVELVNPELRKQDIQLAYPQSLLLSGR